MRTFYADDTTAMAILGERARWPRWPAPFVVRLYPLPNPMRSLGDYYRARHEDLPHLDDSDLRAELARVRMRRALEQDAAAAAWLAEREDRLVAELGTRRARWGGVR